MRVLLIPDSFGWAYDNYARGLKGYSKHDITIIAGYPKDGLTPEIINAHDLIFCFSRTIWNAFKPNIRELISNKPNVMWCCGSSFGVPPTSVDRYAVCTERLLGKARKIGVENAVLLREGVDSAVYKPRKKSRGKSLRVGWVGNAKSKRKRAHLLKLLDYPVRTMQNHDKKFRVKNRKREPMVNFYNSIDVYVTLMRQNGAHGIGRTLLEAMSCGCPVVATDITSAFKVVPREWLIPAEPDEVAVKEMNDKLRLLNESRDLLTRVGDRNRQFILDNYSWKIIAEDWDQLFGEVALRGIYAKTRG